MQHSSRGSLQDVLLNEDIHLDWSFKASFLQDIVKGMSYLHNSFLNFHGRLSSNVCVVTNRWVVKIEGFGLLNLRRTHGDFKEDDCYKNQLWMAPEVIRSKMTILGSQKADVFSFAIVAYEILFRILPYNANDISCKEIIEKIVNNKLGSFRPAFPPSDISRNNPLLLDILTECWNEIPAHRPDFNEIIKRLKKIIKLDGSNIVDSMLNKLEKHAYNLESIVQQRTEKLIEEQKKTNMILHSMLPPFVAEELKAGRKVEPRLYQMTSIFFSDIVEFTSLSSESTPFEIVNLLNDLYGTFDDTIAKHNVYKVETIGDAYMVVSGMPEETDRHVVEICNMALDLLSVVRNFKIRHRPSMTLMLRIGIHSGPCAAGVVGRTMPRYCLFGDTVNTASRMESTGKALKIHLSEPAKDELMKFPGYVVKLRGPTELKGKGVMTTYWLLKKDNDHAF